MEFEHISPEGLWSDFSVMTPLEASINCVEQLLRGWKTRQKRIEKKTFLHEQKEFRIVYVPREERCIYEVLDTFQYHEGNVQSVRELFSVSTDFIVFYPVSLFYETDVNLVDSLFVPALEMSGLTIPVFFQKTKAESLVFTGVQFTKNARLYYNSRIENVLPDPFKSFAKIKATFLSSFEKAPEKITISARFLSTLNKMDFLNDLIYNKTTFFLTITQDPIKQLLVYLHFDKMPIDSAKVDITKPDHVSIAPVYQRAPSRVSKLRDLVALVHVIWTYPSISSALTDTKNSNAISEVKAILSSKEKPVAFKCPIIGAPPCSSLSRLAVAIVERHDVESLACMWDEYVKNVRKFFDKHTPIPGIETEGVDYQQCVIYQKLQMINFCISHPDAGFIEEEKESHLLLLDGNPMIIPERQTLAMRTSDQVLEEGKIISRLQENDDDQIKLQNIQIRSDIGAFKASNPTSSFVDFVRWYTPHNYDDQTRDLKPSINEDWIKLWDKTNPATARNQTRLFDPNTQAEIAIDYLETLAPGDILTSIIPILFETSLYIISHKGSRFPFVNKSITDAERTLLSFQRRIKNGYKTMMDYASLCVEPIESIENAAFQYSIVDSLLQKFPGCPNAVSTMLEDNISAFAPSERASLEVFFRKCEFRGRQVASCRAREYVVISESPGFVGNRLFISDQSERSIIASVTSDPTNY